jgi:hypothetical protein
MLREYFPAALGAFEGVIGDLAAADVLELLERAPDPDTAARLSRAQIAAALKRARRRDVDTKTATIQSVLRAEALRQPVVLAAAYAAGVRSLVAVIGVLNLQIAVLQGQVEAHFGEHPAVEIHRSQSGLGDILGVRVLGEFGDDPHRYADARARRTTRHQPDHPRLGPQEGRAGPLRPQRPPRRRVGAENCVMASDQRLRGRPTSRYGGSPSGMIAAASPTCPSVARPRADERLPNLAVLGSMPVCLELPC